MDGDVAQPGRMPRLHTPGVYFDERSAAPRPAIPTGQPVFFGFAGTSQPPADAGEVRAAWLTAAEQYGARVGPGAPTWFLAAAVRGFFENGGRRCLVLTTAPPADDRASDTAWDRTVTRWLDALDNVEAADATVDLLCAPDLPTDGELRLRTQRQLLEYCDRTRGRFAILDTGPGVDWRQLREQAAGQWHTLVSPNGALYYPWLKLTGATVGWVPPCGHVAGIYARTDQRIGPHKAPANERIAGAVDVQDPLDDAGQAHLNAVGVNCLRVLPGRGIRVWGARTLSGRADWRYVNVRRLFITVERRLEYECRDLVFEPNDPPLWERVREQLIDSCYRLFQAGALKGDSPGEAYYVKCDEETNPPAHRDVGIVTAELGLAPTTPAEFIVVRITRDLGGAIVLSTLQTEGS